MAKRIFNFFMILIITISNSGCAAYLAAKQPGYINTGKALRAGTPRMQVISELGPPISNELNDDGNLVEYYQFKQGYKTSTKVLRVVFHIGADFFTLFLWEAVGIPIEVIFDGNRTTVIATYDHKKKLKETIVNENSNFNQ